MSGTMVVRWPVPPTSSTASEYFDHLDRCPDARRKFGEAMVRTENPLIYFKKYDSVCTATFVPRRSEA